MLAETSVASVVGWGVLGLVALGGLAWLYFKAAKWVKKEKDR